MADPAPGPLQTTPEPLHEWLGFGRMLLTPSGTAALTAGVRALARRAGCAPGAVDVPALACWTLTTAVRQAGAKPRYLDIDTALGPRIPPDREPNPLGVTVAPWSGRLSGGEQLVPQTIMDASVGVFAPLPGGTRGPDIAVISLGAGKPLHRPGGGGLVLFDDPAIAESLRFDLAHGRSGQMWLADGPRLVPGSTDVTQLGVAITDLAVSANERRHSQARAISELTAICPMLRAALPQGPVEGTGVSTVLPVLLDRDYPLSARDVHRAAVAHGMPLAVQPVTPPYLEPAGRDLTGDCPTAESVGRRLLFVPAEPLPDFIRSGIASLLDVLATRPAEHTYPYGLSPSDAPPPEQLRGPVTLARRLDRRFVAADELTGKTYAVSADVAARILGRAERGVSW